ncbi:hypothetical protein [Bradyrhizobium sp. CCBAU 53421]|uniref:hypothetical protein n=1 Tax=Bradyrhizobium sp. CCBAU 53421 TaxID=1325120 RepID=UPI00188D3C8C|nr:hypothetical protein [Bradyrhizobium sp. CCBAU 53421]
MTKRLIKGLIADPEGWPKDSPLWDSTMSSYRVLPRCHRYLTPTYRQLVSEMAASKRAAHLRSSREMVAFLSNVTDEWRGRRLQPIVTHCAALTEDQFSRSDLPDLLSGP